jgi:hypothetical protein
LTEEAKDEQLRGLVDRWRRRLTAGQLIDRRSKRPIAKRFG